MRSTVFHASFVWTTLYKDLNLVEDTGLGWRFCFPNHRSHNTAQHPP